MKKIYLILFIVFSFFSFSNQTYDDTKFRQDLVNWANSKIGQSYSMNNRWGETTFDCSSFISRGLGATGMTSISGKKGDYGTTANGLYRASGQIVKGQGTNGLKAGDIAHFSLYSSGTTGHVGIITEIIDSCRVRMTHASNSKPYPKGGVKSDIKNLCSDSHYIGATSATQVLINNGYTPVNADGTVVAPAGSTVPGQEGRMQNFEKNYKRSISFDEIASQYQAIVKERVTYLAKALVPIVSLLFAIDLVVFGIRSYFGSSTNFIKDFILRCAKFSFFIYVIKNVSEMMNMIYKMFHDIAFSLSGVETASVDSIVDMYIEVTKNLFGSLMTFNFAMNMIFNGGQAIGFALFVIIIAIALGVGYFQLCFEMFSVSIQFFLAVGLSLTLFPLKVAKITEKYGTDPLSSALVCGTRMIITLVMCGVAMQLLEKTKITGEALKTMDYVQLSTIMIYTLVICFLVKKINSTFSQFR